MLLIAGLPLVTWRPQPQILCRQLAKHQTDIGQTVPVGAGMS